MKRVPRELCVTLSYHHFAYEDRALPIGFNQTISQSYIIVLMTQALELNCRAPTVPTDLIAQLAIGGLVIPVGIRYVQELYNITRKRNKNKMENLGSCYFA